MIALGVTGCIGAYKAAEVLRGLQRHGHEVTVVMTRHAQEFIAPLTFEAISGRPVITDQFAPGANAAIEHVALASDIALLLVAPATANIIGKFASGIADDFLSSLYLATRAPVLIAPAMNTQMLTHEAVQANLRTLAARGVRFVEPGEGYLACGWIGKGRLADPEAIVTSALDVLKPRLSLAGRTVLVSAGPTLEDIDAVRFIGNRSSGRMGYALARAAAACGARVVLVSGPTDLDAPPRVERVAVRSAAQMRDAMLARAGEADVIIMAAAVADYTPARAVPGKIKKGAATLQLDLRKTDDILALLSARATGAVLVGFAAESDRVLEHARAKLVEKRLDLIVANDISRADAGFEAETNAVWLLAPGAPDEEVPLQSKDAVAARILDRIEQRLTASAEGPRAAR